MDYHNKNGLVRGKVPSGVPCPFVKRCSSVSERCPTAEHLLEHEFSCARARLMSLCIEIKEGERRSI